MNIGNHLFQARKRSGLSQEKVAEKLGVSRQTISKWETSETIPDIYQSKRLAQLYHVTLDELIAFDIEEQEIEQTIKNINEEKEAKINWTNVWSKKYPILGSYQKEVDIQKYEIRINQMIQELKREYNYNHLESFLVLKDILYHVWKGS